MKYCLRFVDLFYSHAEPENEILESFRAFDYQGSGTISASEFQTVMRNYGEALTVAIRAALLALLSSLHCSLCLPPILFSPAALLILLIAVFSNCGIIILYVCVTCL